MPNKSYSEKLRDPRWQKKRLEILSRDQFICRTCGDEKSTLEVHHLSYRKDPWDVPDEQLVTLCSHCHRVISHFGINILTQLESPLTCCFKVQRNGGQLCFFQYTYGFIICIVEGSSVHEIVNMKDRSLRDLMQCIINNWLFIGKDHLLIDQSPVHYGA